MILKIYDASWLLHFGSNSRRYKDFSYAGYSLGGLKYLVKNVCFDMAYDQDVIVCFDSKTNKSSAVEGYKKHRPFQAHILSQANFAYNMLSKAGVTCLKEDGTEADDLIASCVAKFKSQYKQIIIVSNDKDLTHNVTQNVSVEATSSDGLDVNIDNFSNVLSKNTFVKANTVSAYKVFTGDASDGIPTFKSENGIRGVLLYEDFIDEIQQIETDNHTSDTWSTSAILQLYIDCNEDLTESDRSKLASRMNVIFPTIVDLSDNPSNRSNFDGVNLAKLLTLVKELEILGYLELTESKLSQEEFNSFRAAAATLRNGTFAVDNDCPVDYDTTIPEGKNMRLF